MYDRIRYGGGGANEYAGCINMAHVNIRGCIPLLGKGGLMNTQGVSTWHTCR